MQNQIVDSNVPFAFGGSAWGPVLALAGCVASDLALKFMEPLFPHVTFTCISDCGEAFGTSRELSPPSFLLPGAVQVI